MKGPTHVYAVSEQQIQGLHQAWSPAMCGCVHVHHACLCFKTSETSSPGRYPMPQLSFQISDPAHQFFLHTSLAYVSSFPHFSVIFLKLSLLILWKTSFLLVHVSTSSLLQTRAHLQTVSSIWFFKKVHAIMLFLGEAGRGEGRRWRVYRILVPQARVEPSSTEAQSPNQWTTKEWPIMH